MANGHQNARKAQRPGASPLHLPGAPRQHRLWWITCQPIPAKPRERRSEVMADTSKLTKEQRKRQRRYARLLPQIDAFYNDLYQR